MWSRDSGTEPLYQVRMAKSIGHSSYQETSPEVHTPLPQGMRVPWVFPPHCPLLLPHAGLLGFQGCVQDQKYVSVTHGLDLTLKTECELFGSQKRSLMVDGGDVGAQTSETAHL